MTTTTTSEPKVKFPEPPSFTGEATEVDSFISRIEASFEIHTNQFPNDKAKIIYTLGFCNSGIAKIWADEYLKDLTTRSVYPTPFTPWTGFKKEFLEYFQDETEARRARQSIRGIKQDNRTMKQFITLFRVAAHKSGYDKYALIDHLKRAVNNQGIVKQIMRDHPKLDKIEDWYSKLVEYDYANLETEEYTKDKTNIEFIQKIEGKSKEEKSRATSFQNFRQNTNTRQWGNQGTNNRTNFNTGQFRPTNNNQLNNRNNTYTNTMRTSTFTRPPNTYNPQIRCYNCGRTGHIARNCLNNKQINVRYVQEEIEDDLTQLQEEEPQDVGQIIARRFSQLNDDDFKEIVSQLVTTHTSKVIKNGEQLEIPITINAQTKGNNLYQPFPVDALIDSGTTTSLIHYKWAEQNNIQMEQLTKPITLSNVDRSSNTITHFANIQIIIQDVRRKDLRHVHNCIAYVANIGNDNVILGLNWLKETNPNIDWKRGWVSIMEDTPGHGESFQFYTIRGKYHPVQDAHVKATYEYDSDDYISDDGSEIIDSYIDEAKEDGIISRHLGSTTNDNITDINQIYLMGEKDIEEDHIGKEKENLDIPDYAKQFTKVFSEEASNRFPISRPWDHPIDLIPEAKPWQPKVYPLNPTETQALTEFIQENLSKGYIRESTSEYATPFFFVKKKNGKLRPVQDYRQLNALTIKRAFPLPRIDDLVESLSGATIFTKFDLRWGYNNVRIKDGDQHKAAFITKDGLYEPMVMFFGLCNSPATFQAMMNALFKDLIFSGHVVIYMDDILIFNNDITEHRNLIVKVLQRLQDNDLYLNPDKCFFEKDEIEYLGVIVSHNKITMDPAKVTAIMDYPRPTKVKEVRQFLGLAGYNRRFIEGFANIARPLHDLTRDDHEWYFGPAQVIAFQTLKMELATQPVLLMPNQDEPFYLTCDASDVATGAILQQKDDKGHLHPIAYFSKSLNQPERNYPIYDKELLAIIKALLHWRHYLMGAKHQITVFSDHKNLEYFMKGQNLSQRQQRWMTKLTDFDFVIAYKSGAQNAADALSRRPDHNPLERDNQNITLLPESVISRNTTTTTVSTFEIPETMKTALQDYSKVDNDLINAVRTILKKGTPIQIKQKIPDWDFQDGYLTYQNLIYVPANFPLRQTIVKQHHDNPLAGHAGQWATKEFIQRTFWWPNMTQFIKKYIEGCTTCQMNRIRTNPTKYFIQPNDIPSRPFQIITSDFMTDLPECEGYDSILIFVDRFSKTLVALPCTKTITAGETAQLMIKSLIAYFGIPQKIISDRGTQYNSKVFQEICTSLGIKSAMSTAYHPQTDGQSERLNQDIQQYLRNYISTNQTEWYSMLPLVTYNHNIRPNSAIGGYSPFEVLMGFQPSPIPPITHEFTSPDAETRIYQLQTAWKEVEAALTSQAKLMQLRGTPKDRGRSYSEGDLVWLEGKNLKTVYPTLKFAPKRVGPFKIIKRIGEVNYKLELPDNYRIHNVFHVALLSPYITTPEYGRPYEMPPPDLIDGEEEWEIESVINSRKHRNKIQYFVKWKGFPMSDNSWEPADNLEHSAELVAEFHQKNQKAFHPHQLSMTERQKLPKSIRESVFTVPTPQQQ
jgi:hypothetical protein